MSSVELLYWEGCPSTAVAREQLRDALTELGHGDQAVAAIRVDTEEQARRERFVGSPTIRVDGEDILAPPHGEPTMLACRVYRLRDGRYSPTPDPEDLREALRARL